METSNQEIKSSAAFLPEYMKMYEISGQDAITLHSFARYQKDKEDQEKTIEYLSLNSASYRRELIRNAPLNEKASLIRIGLENGNMEVQSQCAIMIGYLLPEEQAELREKVFLLIEKGLREKNPETQKAFAEMIQYAPSENMSILIEKGLGSGNSEVQKICAQMIWHISDTKKKDALREKLSTIINAGLQNHNEEDSGKAYASMIKYALDKDRASLVKTGLLSADPEVQKEYASVISDMSDEETTPLVEMVFSGNNTEAQRACAHLIQQAPKEKRAPLLHKGLSSNDRELEKICASFISYAEEGTRYDLRDMVASRIEKSFIDNNAESQTEYAQMIQYAPEDKQPLLRDAVARLAEKGMSGNSEEAKKVYATMIWNAPKEKRTKLIQKGLESNNSEVEQVSVYAIAYAPDDDKASLTETGLKSGDVGVQRMCTSLIYSAPEETRSALIQTGLESDNIEIQKKCAAVIPYAQKNKQNELREHVALLAEQRLANGDAEIQKKSLWMIPYVAEGRRASIINTGLRSESEEVRKESARMIEFAPQNEKGELFERAKNTVGKYLVEPPLYRYGKVSDKHFLRQEFIKTGSGTTLLGGELKDNTIIRHIEFQPFLTWQKLYEDHNLWKNVGFDYVPIESIQSFKINKDGLVDVYSGVLDLSLASWEKMTDDFAAELDKDRDKIKKVLRDNAIIHGHPHDDNFCLRFFRDENGNVDFNKKPRIYLIDFDMAESPE